MKDNTKTKFDNPQELRERISELKRQIEEANFEYYTKDQPQMSDRDYDATVRELEELEKAHPEFALADSPTRVIGPPPAQGFAQIEHAEPLLGLSNAYDLDELEAWVKRVKELLDVDELEYVAELKIDGLAVVLKYEDGNLVSAATRGDGVRGEAVTDNIATIESVPAQIPNAPPLLEIRTEVYMPRKGFYKLNSQRAEEGLPEFANPRNAAAGAVRQQDPSVTASRPLDFFAFGISKAQELGLRTHMEALEQLSSWGFRTNPHNTLIKDLDSLKTFCNTWQTKRDNLDYDTDGVVVKVNDLRYQIELGSIFRAPRWAIAYKFPPMEATTIVRSIFLIVGREGDVIPYASIQPVEVGGATLSVVPLHNEDYIKKKDIRIGDKVVVRRAGDIRPQIVKSLPELRTGHEDIFQWPSLCPACGVETARETGEAAWKCPNPDCVGKLYQKIKQFVSEQAMDIRGIGDALAGHLASSGKINDVGDLFYLTREDFIELGLTSRKSTNILRSLERSKTRSLSRLIFGLGIADIGLSTAKTLADRFASLDELASATKEELMTLPRIGKKTAERIRSFFEDPANQLMIDKLRNAGVSFGY